jgi:phosphoribosylformylglycinamidine synthase subunit PurS
MPAYRFSVDVMPKDGILDPQGRAVERSLPHLGVSGVHGVRVGRRVELTVDATGDLAALAVVERLARELFANPLIERWTIDADGEVAGERAGERTEERAGADRDHEHTTERVRVG